MTAGSRHPIGPKTTATCRDLDLAGPELALGISSRQERSAALAHLRRCPHCRKQLAEASRIAGRLPELLPPVEPPSGFAEQVIASVGRPPTSAGHPDRTRTRPQRRGFWRRRT